VTVTAVGSAFGDVLSSNPRDPFAAARIARRSCSECGSSDLAWKWAFELLQDLPYQEAVTLRASDGFVASGEAWVCRSCGNWGCFGEGEAL
jgi:hypothetical protein